MPLLKIETNAPLPDDRQALMALVSTTTASLLGKPERYVMVALTHNPDMLFGGIDSPLAYLELKSIGLPGATTRQLSEALCTLINRQLDIPVERIYIEFADARRNMWGWNSATFER